MQLLLHRADWRDRRRDKMCMSHRAAWHADYRANGFFAWLGLPRFSYLNLFGGRRWCR
eukprot:COSAG06_NODE_64799_length_258_cov_1.276730_1_plen_57_part_01